MPYASSPISIADASRALASCIVSLVLVIIPLPSNAQQFSEYLKRFGGEAEKILLSTATEIITDRVRSEISAHQFIEVIGRDKEANRAFDILVRIKGKNPVFVGPAGVGKTTVVDKMAALIVRGQIPQAPAFKAILEDAEIILTTPAKISELARKDGQAIEIFFNAILETEKNYSNRNQGRNKSILVFIDEFHAISEAQIEAMKPYLDSRQRAIKLIGATTLKELKLALKHNEAMERRVEPVGVEELTPENSFDLLRGSWIPEIQKRYQVTFSDDAIRVAIRLGPSLKPENARPDGPFKILQDLAIKTHRINQGHQIHIDDISVYRHATEVTGLPSNPHDGKEFSTYLDGLKSKLNVQIVGQQPMIESVVEQFGDLLMGESTRPKVLVIMGPSRVGKSHLARSFARVAYGSENHFFRIDGTAYSAGAESGAMNALMGAAPGMLSSNKEPGQLMQFLDDPARGKYGGVILIDEAEKMSQNSWQRLMELFDLGEVTGGDGKVRKTNRHIIILTSNRGSRYIFPDSVKDWPVVEVNRRIMELTRSDLKDFFTRSSGGRDTFQLPVEVVNRIDEFVVASPLDEKSAATIGELEAQKFRAEIYRKFRVKLSIDERLVEHLALTGFSKTDGAAQINRNIESYLKRAFRTAQATWDLPKDVQLNLTLEQTGPVSEPTIRVTNGSGDSITSRAPKERFSNPLGDPEILEKLKNLSGKLGERIIGQDMLIRSAVESLYAKYGDSTRYRPISLFLIGQTGIGKTEFAKALAEALFGSAPRAAIIPLGGVRNDADLNKVFGSEPGYSGHTTEWLFEQALIQNPTGGVIAFDEASNMGGDSKSRKEALFKQFYNILDEGKWTSPVNGKTYDLKNYIFIFSGNDGETLFQGISSDDLRLSAWKANNSREKVRELLRAAGVPEAFLGRMADVLLLKPLTTEEMIRVTEKLLNDQIKRFEKQNRGIQIAYDSDFLKHAAFVFFTQDLGGRSVRKVLEERVGGIWTAALVRDGYSPEDLPNTTLRMKLSDNFSAKPYRRSRLQDREVILTIDIVKHGRSVSTFETNLIEHAAERPRGNAAQVKSTSFHEAGHALLNDPELTGERVAHITCLGGTKKDLAYFGYTRYEAVAGRNQSPDRNSTLAHLVRLMGGRVAQKLAGLPEDGGWSSDLKKIHLIGAKYLVSWGMEPSLWAVQINENGEPELSDRQREIFDRELLKLIREAEEIATELLAERWGLVRAVTARLIQRGFISGEEFSTLASGLQLKAKRIANRFTLKDFQNEEARRTEVRIRSQEVRGSNSDACSAAFVLTSELLKKIRDRK